MNPPVWWWSALLVNALLSVRSSSSLAAAEQGQALRAAEGAGGRDSRDSNLPGWSLSIPGLGTHPQHEKGLQDN